MARYGKGNYGKGNPIPDDVKKDILLSPLTVKQLADKHGVQSNTIYKILRSRNKQK